jgi:hypothetical protein
MATTRIKGRFISCWRQADDEYHLTVSHEGGGGDVIELSKEHMLHVLGATSNGHSVDFAITEIDAPADATSEP